MDGAQTKCPVCGVGIEPVDGRVGSCPACGPTLPAGRPAAAVCAICQSAIGEGEITAACPSCVAAYHEECWQENGGCAVYGCPQVPAVEHRSTLEIPVSYWGQEHKPCPACAREILAAALRCRHCGTVFATARPENTAEFQRRGVQEQRMPRLKTVVTVFFVCAAIPCFAPMAAVWGMIWVPRNREDIAALPSLYGALSKIGLGIAIVQTVALIVVGLVYGIVRAD